MSDQSEDISRRMIIYRVADPLSERDESARYVHVESRGVRVLVRSVRTGEERVMLERDLTVVSRVRFLSPHRDLELLLLSLALVPERYDVEQPYPIMWTADARVSIMVEPKSYTLQLQHDDGSYSGGSVANLSDLKKHLKNLPHALK